MKKLAFAAAVASAVSYAGAAGFGIYEASARGNALGDAVIGNVSDATANYHNPANIAFSTNVMVATGVTFINPYCDVEVDHVSQDRMNPGWFTVPTFYASAPLGNGFALGWGNYTEYGLGSHYNGDWALAADTKETTMRQVTLNPNLAYSGADWWSVSAGIRGSWIQFKNHKHPYSHTDLAVDANGLGTLYARDPFNLRTTLKGEDWGMGWNAAATLKPHKKVQIGLVYRSHIRHKIKGRFNLAGDVSGTASGTIAHPIYGQMPYSMDFSEKQSAHTRASAKLTLPESLALGMNWDVTGRYRIGAVATYTRWSSVGDINFRISHGYGYRLPLNWHDTVRAGVGMEYDFLSWLSGRIGYTYDQDPSRKHNSTTMLPAGDRHIIGAGLGFRITDRLSLDLGYNFIRMNNQHYSVYVTDKQGESQSHHFSCRNGYSHLVSATLRYSF